MSEIADMRAMLLLLSVMTVTAFQAPAMSVAPARRAAASPVMGPFDFLAFGKAGASRE